MENRESKRLERLLKAQNETEVEIFSAINELEDKVEEYKNSIPDSKLLLSGIKQLKGEKGDKGDKGDDGKDGADGKDGIDGYTPVKGEDYFDGEDGKPGKDAKISMAKLTELVKKEVSKIEIKLPELDINGMTNEIIDKVLEKIEEPEIKYEVKNGWFRFKTKKGWGEWIKPVIEKGQMFGASFDPSFVHTETGQISDLSGLDTQFQVNAVVGFIINGQGMHDLSDFTIATNKRRLNYNTALDSSFSGLNYTIKYL